MLLADLVAASNDVRDTAARNAKIARVAQLLDGLDPDDLRLAVAYLAGALPQGRIGVGWAAVGGLDIPPAAEPGLSLQDVAEVAIAIADEVGSGSAGRRGELLQDLFARATEDEQAFLRGLLLGELRQGAKEGVMVEAVARACEVKAAQIRRALMLLGDLPEASAVASTGGTEALAAVGLRVGRPIRPMLASTAETVTDALETTMPATVDAKLDGMRVQVHKDGDEVLVVTRSLRDVTAGMPGVVELVRSLDATSLVLDGEALGVRDDGRPAPFQETMSDVPDRSLRPFFFDLLHRDGEDLLDRPLRERLAHLDEVVPPTARVARLDDPSPDAGEAFAAEVLAAGHEGVLVKSLDSTYAAGRRGKAWIKVKPSHTLDLVVLAVEWGSGRRTGWLSNLHLGARREGTEDEFVMLGKTFKGLTDHMLQWQTDHLLGLEVRRTKHVVHVRSELVVEIAFDGVQDSRRYPGGVALRFARVKAHRPDKPASEADTLESILAIRDRSRA